jgi:hypothetical protein
MRLLSSYTDWRRSWTLVIPGNFSNGNTFTDLLFYDKNAGQGEFYSTYLGNITLLEAYSDWRATWDLIVPGIFNPSPWTGLLFYDRVARVGQFYSTDGHGGITLLTNYGDWRNSWTHIISGHLGGPQTDLLFYDANSGDLELYQVRGNGNLTDDQGNYAPWRSYAGWTQGWTHIVPGRFGGGQYTNFLFYNAATGEASFYSSDGAGNLLPLKDVIWNANHSLIVGGLFGGIETDLVFYEATNNTIAVFLEYQRDLNPLSAGDLPTGIWTHIVPGIYSNSGYTDLLLYDVASGVGNFYCSETPVEWRTGLIQGYAGATSVLPGETLPFHVSCKVGLFALDIFRIGINEEMLFQAQGSSSLLAVGDEAYAKGCGWPSALNVVVPNDWSSGLYIARISATDGEIIDSKDIPFVVKAPQGRQSRILCILPFATIQAYNRWGGRSLYGHSVDDDSALAFQWNIPRAFKVSFDRPVLYPNIGDDPALSDVNFRWSPFIRWCETSGFAIDYCTSVDLHADPLLLAPYNLILSIAHDEYWSKEMRDNVEAFATEGGNVAFFSGNVCWWQVRFENENKTMVCYKDAALDPLTSSDPSRSTVNWYDVPVNRPENSMTGVSWRNGAVGVAGAHFFVTRDAGHWVFAGTGFVNGDPFGTDVFLQDPPGTESDAALFVDSAGGPIPTGQDGTPLTFAIVATADLTGWISYLGGPPRATMGLYTRPGIVFTAATTDWTRGLTIGGTPAIQIITTNILTRLSAGRQSRPRENSKDWTETIGRRPPDRA